LASKSHSFERFWPEKATFRTGVITCSGKNSKKSPPHQGRGANDTQHSILVVGFFGYLQRHFFDLVGHQAGFCQGNPAPRRVRFQRAVSYSRLGSFEYTRSKIEKDVLNFCVSAETNPRIFVIARKEWRNEIGRFLIIVFVVVFPSLQLLLTPDLRRV
jgi:hypothetical protein